jgi:hypothetical protein
MCDELGSIREVDLVFQDITIVWKIQAIQKIISFFFLESQSPSVPPVPQARKRIIEVSAIMRNFHLICIHNDYITGIVKMENSKISYKTTATSEVYNFLV